MELFHKHTFLIALSGALLSSCGGENENSSLPQGSVEIKPKSGDESQAARPSYDFERQLQKCALNICELLPSEKMKASDYSPDLIAGMGLSKDDRLNQAREKLELFYEGTVSSGLGSTTDPNLNLVHAQLSPGNNAALPEYDVFIRTDGMSNEAKIYDWGARVRCAPVSDTTTWQTTPCK